MAHELESMMYTGATPWHGLGVHVNKAPSTREAIVAAGLDWTVETVDLATVDGTAVPMRRATRRTSDGRILGVVGPEWTPLQNARAFDFFDPFLAAGEATLETAGSLFDGARVWVLAKLNRDPMQITKGDDVQKYVLLANGHDGSLAVRVGFTPIRVVCNNTLSMAVNAGGSSLIRVRHTRSVAESLDELRETMNAANAAFEATAEQYRRLAARPINTLDLARYVKQVFRAPERATEDGEADANATEANAEVESKITLARIIPLFEKGRGNDLPGTRGTLWAAYNAVTEHLAYERGKTAGGSERKGRGGVARTDGQDRRLNELWFGAGAKLNKRALQAAIAMAA